MRNKARQKNSIPPLEFRCEHCDQIFEAELQAPIAVRCTKCDSVFDARLQFVGGARKDFLKASKPEK